LLKFESDLVCALCHNGKMIIASHSSVNTVMTERTGKLLHMDTIGPSRVRSMGGKWYVLVVDDYSCYSWVFFLESKDEVFKHFQSLSLRLNNEHPNCLKAIHSDNGIESRNASFDEFYLEHDIDQQFFTPRIPQQNGVMKQKNRTLVEMTRTMLDEHRTPRRFWADAINTACYISNQIFLCLILHLTPFELRFGCNPSVSHLRPFGCKCFF
jgi:transposase InsO family protein